MCQIDVLYGKSLIIDFLDDCLKKRTAIKYTTNSLKDNYSARKKKPLVDEDFLHRNSVVTVAASGLNCYVLFMCT